MCCWKETLPFYYPLWLSHSAAFSTPFLPCCWTCFQGQNTCSALNKAITLHWRHRCTVHVLFWLIHVHMRKSILTIASVWPFSFIATESSFFPFFSASGSVVCSVFSFFQCAPLMVCLWGFYSFIFFYIFLKLWLATIDQEKEIKSISNNESGNVWTG